MNKKGLLGLIIILLVLFVGGFFWFIKMYDSAIPECKVNADCVPDRCCHAASCTIAKEAPKCGGTFCTADCEPDTMDCGQGSCGCIEGKCSAVYEK